MTSIKVSAEIVSIDFMVPWSFKTSDQHDNCAICRKNLMEPSHEDIKKNKEIHAVSTGQCGHSFHAECVDQWVKTGQIICPIDKTPWNKILDGNTKYAQIGKSLKH